MKRRIHKQMVKNQYRIWTQCWRVGPWPMSNSWSKVTCKDCLNRRLAVSGKGK